MKQQTVVALLILCCAALTAAQSDREKEVLRLTSDYEQAILKKDVAFFERLLAPDYVFSNPGGTTEDRAKTLEMLRKEKATPTSNLVSLKSDDMRAHVAGDMAVVTGTWTSQTTRVGDDPGEPHTDTGRYTVVYAKRDGRWMAVAEHVSEKPHTPSDLEPGLRKASEEYDRAMRQRDAAAMSRLLADDYIYTNEDGKTRNKAEDLAMFNSPDMKLDSASADDKKFRIYRNSAVETGRYSVVGTIKGKPFTEIGRYTSTWIYRDGRWQMVADHTSVLKQ